MKLSFKLIITSIVTGVAASLCCITPILAIVAGVGGMASLFSWVEPLRPYLIVVTLIVLIIAWYVQLKAKKSEPNCDCETEKNSKTSSSFILGFITVFVGLSLSFPYYANYFITTNSANKMDVNSVNWNQTSFKIEGMTCSGCEVAIEKEVANLVGVISVDANYDKSNAIVKFDTLKVSIKEIEKAISKTGYQVVK